uniref:IGFBP-related protein 1 n=1 Tax=Dynamene bidentata TaxID=2461553 RepID=A0A3G4TE75_9CRUS|nr:IGFBP-related protein 1 [Dynamene bidentata]
MFVKFTLFILISLFCTSIYAEEECTSCERSECAALSSCPSGVTQDACGCCEICAQTLGQQCDYISDDVTVETPVNQTCGEYLFCNEQGFCECSEEGAVCGSDDVTYNSICELILETVKSSDLTLVNRAACRKGPVIKTSPKDAVRPLGSILVLDCEATGYPVPSISWEYYRQDGATFQLPNDDPLVAVQVRGGPEKHMVTGWVQIMKILPENTGIYTCIATNDKGTVKASAKISLSKSKIPKKF